MKKGIIIIMAVTVLLVTACTTTKVVTVERVRKDTLRENRIERDSIYMHDSIRISEKGDTVTIERWHTRYRDRLLLDTIYESHTDSVPVPYPVETLVERQLSWWQRTQMYAGDVLLLLLAGGLVYGAIRLKSKPFG